MLAEIEDPLILITDKKISAVADVLPVLEKILKVSKNIVVIAEDIEGEALATLVINNEGYAQHDRTQGSGIR